MYTLGRCTVFNQRDNLCDYLFAFYIPIHYWRGSTPQGQKLLPTVTNSYLLELNPFQKGAKHKQKHTSNRIVSPERVFIPLKPLLGSESSYHIIVKAVGKTLFQPNPLVMLNKLRCHAHFPFSANQITWSRLLIPIHTLNGKQCRARSVGFFRSQLIWIYIVCNDRIYLDSAGPGLIFSYFSIVAFIVVFNGNMLLRHFERVPTTCSNKKIRKIFISILLFCWAKKNIHSFLPTVYSI